jgi:hypothetical protein
MTNQEEDVTRTLLRHYLEQARAAASRLPEFEGAATIRALNELLEKRLQPRRPFWPRAVEDPPEAA